MKSGDSPDCLFHSYINQLNYSTGMLLIDLTMRKTFQKCFNVENIMILSLYYNTQNCYGLAIKGGLMCPKTVYL